MRLSFLSILFLLTNALSAAPKEARLSRCEFSQVQIGTQFSIILYARDANTATRVSNAAFSRIEQLDAIMSDYRATSELMKLCRRSGGEWVKVSAPLFDILAKSQKLSTLTDGAFDVTVGP